MTQLVLTDGAAHGPALVLDAPLSFWGGFDPQTGEVIDRSHPQSGAILTGKVVLMAESRGSATSPGTLAEAIRLGMAPAAMIMVSADVNLAIGATVAETLYDRSCPILQVSHDDFAALRSARAIAIAPDGRIAVES